MKDKDLEMLEFPRVKEILAGYTSFAISKERVMALRPSTSPEQITGWMKQSAEARYLLSIEPDLTIGGVYDIREPVILASRGKILELTTLLDIQRTLSGIRYLHNKLSRFGDEAPLLYKINSGISPLPRLEKEIQRCVSPGAELLDTASDRLAELRQTLREKRQQILNRLDSIIKSRDMEKYIQEPLITERNGRYVVPVKIELRREMKGIVHDISNTGATAFMEPMSTIDLGNELREAVIEEQHEVEKILTALSGSVGDEAAAILQNLNLVAEIDLALAKARFADRFKAAEPLICDSRRNSKQAGVLRLINARHPLLKGKPVPLNIEIGRDFKGIIITGPNTGGKTVALKTIGLLAVMAQAGMPIPAAPESSMPVFDNIFADIGDEQSIEQTLSTFSWHMGNIVNILRESSDKSLVLMDELGTATDPGEGAALAQSILLHFISRGTMVVATTHFSELKAFGHATPGLQNASLDFDPVTLKPTYHLTTGIPGGSNAMAVASQLGLPDEIISGAKERLSKGALEIETLLTGLMNEKHKFESLQATVKNEKDEVENLRKQLEEEGRKFKDQEQQLLRETRARLIRDGDELQKEIREALQELKKNKTREKLEQAQKALSEMREQLRSQAWQPSSIPGEDRTEEDFSPGDRVLMRDLNLQGTVVSTSDSAGQLEVQVGNTRVNLSPENLKKIETSPQTSGGYAAVRKSLSSRSVSRELDLRGKRADEVEPELEAYLNDASLSNMAEVRIIHGMATGTVRQIVRQFLASHPLVESFRSGKKEEGGDGVTIVKL